jgi:hypothetical protein
MCKVSLRTPDLLLREIAEVHHIGRTPTNDFEVGDVIPSNKILVMRTNMYFPPAPLFKTVRSSVA